MKVIRDLEDSGLLIKVGTETVENEVKEQQGGFLGMLVASLLGNMLAVEGVFRASKGTIRAGKGTIRVGKGVLRAGEGTIRAGQDFYCCLIL